MLFVFFLALSLFTFTSALHASEAGVVDWHKPNIGVPLIHSKTASPSFHRFKTKSGRSKNTKSVVLSVTNGNVLAAVNATSGDIAWRFAFDVNEPVIGYASYENVVVSLSGPGGSTFRSFDVANGDLITEKRLHLPEAGHLSEPSDLGVHFSFAKEDSEGKTDDVFVLTNGHTVRRLDPNTGNVKWEWVSPDRASSTVYSRIVRTPSTIYVVGLTKSVASYSVYVSSLSSSTGLEIASAHIPSAIHNGLTDFLVLSDDTGHYAIAAWLEYDSSKPTQSQIRFANLNPDMKGQPKALKGATFERLLDIGLNERGHFVGLQEDGTALALKFDKDSQGITLVWEFEESAASEKYSDSLYAGGLDKDDKVYIGRIFWSNVLKSASAHLYAPHAANGKGMIRGYSMPFDSSKHGIITHATLDAVQPTENVILGRFVLTTSTGSVQAWQHDRFQWNREEALSEIELANLVELPEKQDTLAHSADENAFARLARQITDAKDFPAYLWTFIKRFATGSYDTTGATTISVDSASLTRDSFGMRKVIVAATRRGIVFGIDSASGAILWQRILGLGWANKIGARHIPLKLFETKAVSDGANPEVVLITQRIAFNGLTDTVLFQFDALTGDDMGEKSTGDTHEGIDIVKDEIVDAFMLEGQNKTIILIDKFLQVYFFPEAEETKSTLLSMASNLHFTLQAPGRILGHRIDPEPSFTGKNVAFPTFTTVLPPNARVIQSFHRPAGETIASLGKVLADRSTLYKYLNPHIVGYLTIEEGLKTESGSEMVCGIYLVDGAKGTVVYRAHVPSLRGSCDVKAVFTENWLAYSYYDDNVYGGRAKGQQIVSVEVYEGQGVDDKTKSSEASVFYDRNADVTIYEQTYIFPYTISAMATTSTKFGMATKDLIVANAKGHIQSFPRRLFDPRRPKRKPSSEEQMEERLIQYDPLIPDDSRRVISHNYHVLNTRYILTSPSLLESTSLVFTAGLDLFVSRVAPSGTFDVLSENFNKLQLVLTIVGLSVAIIVTKPMVKRKKVREQWY